MNRFVLLLFITTAFLFTSCFNEIVEDFQNIDELQWNPTLAVPLVHGSFTIAEFAEELSGDQFATTSRDDGLVVFVYSQEELKSETAEEMVTIQDQNYSYSLKPDALDLPDLPISGTISVQEQHQFDVTTAEDDKLYSVLLKGGSLDLDLNGTFACSGDLVFDFPSLVKDGTALQVTFNWTYDGTNTQVMQQSIDLSQYDIDFTNGGTTTNYFHFTTTLTLTYENQPVTATDEIALNMDLQSLQFSQTLVNVSNRAIANENGSFTLNFMDELAGGVYYFDEPSIHFTFLNSFGVPIQASVNSVTAHSTDRGDLSLTGDIVNRPFTLGHPTVNEIGTVVESELTIDHTNSNIPDILAFQPNTISYSFGGQVNPFSTNDIHFALDTSQVTANIELQLPMIGRFRNLTFTEQYDFEGTDLEDLENALFRLNTVNGLPINADLQLYFLGSTGNFIDSLIYDDQRILLAGTTDTQGKVTSPSEKVIEVALSEDRLIPISRATRLVLRSTLNTPDNNTMSVRIYEEDRLTVNLGIQTEFELTF